MREHNNRTINDILSRVQEAARENGVSLTYTNTKVFLSLLDYAEDHIDDAVRDIKGVRFHATTLELARHCSISPRIVTESLRKFSECGIIKYTTKRPRPSVITIYKHFYE